ncbi:MAG: hypothetical protein KF885_11610 [Anaerolineales bacterium]|nr:hypothetical protein [Anaerolineales bacterium]MCW5876258.1 hypothetical protein [Anaerolineales bacterium]
MNRKIALAVLAALMALSACAPSGGAAQTAQLAAAQQTLDALNAAPANPTSTRVPPTTAPTRVPPTAAPTQTATQAQLPGGRVEPPKDLVIIEFDDVPILPSRMNTCYTERQDMSPFGAERWNEGDQLFGSGPDCQLVFELRVNETNFYNLMLYGTIAPDYGKARLEIRRGDSIDLIYNVELYDPVVQPGRAPLDLGNWLLNKDETNHFVITIYDTNPASGEYKFGFDFMTMECLNQIRGGSC